MTNNIHRYQNNNTYVILFVLMIIEHRRHSKRKPPNPHLNSEGVLIARKIGETMGKFDYVMTSVSPRAIETAVAMGYAVDETVDFSSTVKDLPGTPEELPEGTPFTEYRQRYESNKYFKEWGNRVKSLLMSHLSTIDLDKKILIISHAGIIEISTAVFLKSSDLSSLGRGVDICEGVRFEFDGNKFIYGNQLRL